MLSASHRIDASTLCWNLVNSFPPPFLYTYSLFTSSICIVVSFLVFWSICWILLPSTLRIVPSILWEEQPRYFSLLSDFCYVVWFLIVFLLFPEVFFLNFSFILAGLMMSISNIFKYLWVSFSPSVLIFS